MKRKKNLDITAKMLHEAKKKSAANYNCSAGDKSIHSTSMSVLLFEKC